MTENDKLEVYLKIEDCENGDKVGGITMSCNRGKICKWVSLDSPMLFDDLHITLEQEEFLEIFEFFKILYEKIQQKVDI